MYLETLKLIEATLEARSEDKRRGVTQFSSLNDLLDAFGNVPEGMYDAECVTFDNSSRHDKLILITAVSPVSAGISLAKTMRDFCESMSADEILDFVKTMPLGASGNDVTTRALRRFEARSSLLRQVNSRLGITWTKGMFFNIDLRKSQILAKNIIFWAYADKSEDGLLDNSDDLFKGLEYIFGRYGLTDDNPIDSLEREGADSVASELRVLMRRYRSETLVSIFSPEMKMPSSNALALLDCVDTIISDRVNALLAGDPDGSGAYSFDNPSGK